MKDVKKNKLYFRKDTRENILITSIVHYEGTKEFSISLTKGYGVSESRERLVLNYEEYEKFFNNLEDKQSINIKNDKMEEKKELGNNFKELRSILFDTLRALKDGSIDDKKAKSISEISQVLINSAKVEVDYLKVSGNGGKSKMID